MDSEQELKALEGTLDKCSNVSQNLKWIDPHSLKEGITEKAKANKEAIHNILHEEKHKSNNKSLENEASDLKTKNQDLVSDDQNTIFPSVDKPQRDVSSQATPTSISYKHGPETELSMLVCDSTETGDTRALEQHLQILRSGNSQLIDEKDQAGMTALHFAVSCKNCPAVKLLMEYGANVNMADSLGFTPLFQATGRYPDTTIAKYLLECGKANVNHRNKTGATPLHGATFQGNLECVKLLLAWGANPCIEDEDGTNAFELTNDLAVLTILHDYLIETNAKKDTIDAVCCQCKQIPKDGLKRCGKCYVTLYCSKECQRKHWLQKGHRNNCPVARPFRMGEEVGECVQISFYKVLGSTKSQVKVYQRNALNSLTRSDFLRQRRFIVKVQLPIGPSTGEIMVYNVDRSVEGFVYPHEPGYEKLSKKIEKDGFKQIKTFFWAELCESYDGTFKIFYGKCAPYQLW